LWSFFCVQKGLEPCEKEKGFSVVVREGISMRALFMSCQTANMFHTHHYKENKKTLSLSLSVAPPCAWI
jgi:hypothetical protein